MAGNTGQKGHTIMKNQLVIVLDFGGQYNQLMRLHAESENVEFTAKSCGIQHRLQNWLQEIQLASSLPVGRTAFMTQNLRT